MKKRKKTYKAPKLRSESFQAGVFGQYGGGGTDPGSGPVPALQPFFGLCCP